MAWCVPDQALQLRIDVEDGPTAGELASGHVLAAAHASHDPEWRESPLTIVPDTTARDELV
jgi:hypothetical protein